MPGCESRSLSDSRSKMGGSRAANASSTFGRRSGPTSLRSDHGGRRGIRQTPSHISSTCKAFAVRDGRLVTGQQQYSGRKVAEMIIEMLGV